MKFFEDKIGKIVEKFTVKATEVAQKEVSKTVTEHVGDSLDSFVMLSMVGTGLLCTFGDIFGSSVPHSRSRNHDYEGAKTIYNATFNYYGVHRRKRHGH